MLKLRIPSNYKSIISYAFLFSFFCFILILFYNKIGQVYFQQDEWHQLGKTIYYTHSNFFDIFLKKFASHYIPVTNLYFVIEYLFFGINAKLYLYTGLILHATAGFTFYLLARRLFRNNFIAFFLAVFFILNVEVFQVLLVEEVSFYALSLIFVNILLIKLYSLIKSKKSFGIKKGLILLALFIASIFTHEAWLTLVILVPLFILLFRTPSLNSGKGMRLFLFFLITFTCTRLLLEVILPSDYVRLPQSSDKISILHSLSTLPFKAVTQYVIGYENIYSISDKYQKKVSYFREDTTINQDLMTTTVTYDLIVYYLSSILLIFLICVFYICRKKIDLKNTNIRIFLFSLVWLGAVTAILSLQKRFFNSIDSRYMYLFSEGILLMIGSILSLLKESIANRYVKMAFFIAAGIYFFIFLYYSYFQLQVIQNRIVAVSNLRSSIISQIKRIRPILSNKTVIYLKCSDDCESNSQFGMPVDWIVPFQNGFGWTLLVVYSDSNPKEYAKFFSTETFLWERYSMGYRESNGKGFGYFTNAQKLRDIMNKYNLSESNLLALKYESKKFIIKEMTDQEKNALLNKKSL